MKLRSGATRRYSTILTALCLSVALLTSFPSWPSVDAQTPAELASKFAPVLHFTAGEKFYLTSVDYIIGSSVVKQRMPDGSSVVVDSAPSPSSLGSHNSTDMFLDNKFGTLDAIAADYASKLNIIGQVSYARVVGTGPSTVVQYWLFYPYNNGPLNNHQGDVEVVQVFLDASGNPQRALYSQHGSGENAAWSDVEKSDTHPVVYVAEGSHANFFRPYQGKIGIENDVVGSTGRTLTPNDLGLVMLGEKGNHPPDQSWLDFPGRWGYWGTDEEMAAGKAGPLGPVFNQDGTRWAQPDTYLSSTLSVNGNYFILAWVAAYFLLIIGAYIVARAVWKVLGILSLRKGLTPTISDPTRERLESRTTLLVALAGPFNPLT